MEGTTTDGEQKIEKFLQPLVGKSVDTHVLDTYLTRLTGLGRFESTSYGLTRNDGEVGLLVTVNEPPVLQLAANVNGTQPENVTFEMGGRLTFLDIAGYGSELRTDLEFGNTYGITTELYKRFTQTSRWFYAPRVTASNSADWFYSNGDPQADYRIGRAGVGGDIGYALNRFSEVRAGYEIGYLNASLKLGAPEFSSVKGGARTSRFRFITDHRDNPIVPHYGYSQELTFHWVDTSPGAPAAFPTLDLKTEYFKRISHPSSAFIVTKGGSTLGYEQTGIPQYFLGGTAGLLAYGENELRGNQFFLFRAGYLHRVFTLPSFLGGGIYGIAMYEIGKMYSDPSVSKLPNDGAAGFIARTPLGPLFVGGSVGDTGHATWFFNLGRVF